MGSGKHVGFGKTKGAEAVVLPPNDSHLKHIFRDDAGHLPDTPQNRELLRDLANDKSKYTGTDMWGNKWNTRINDDGSQDWVEYRDGVIREGGRNLNPIPWDPETGLNYNPNNPRSMYNPFII